MELCKISRKYEHNTQGRMVSGTVHHEICSFIESTPTYPNTMKIENNTLKKKKTYIWTTWANLSFLIEHQPSSTYNQSVQSDDHDGMLWPSCQFIHVHILVVIRTSQLPRHLWWGLDGPVVTPGCHIGLEIFRRPEPNFMSLCLSDRQSNLILFPNICHLKYEIPWNSIWNIHPIQTK